MSALSTPAFDTDLKTRRLFGCMAEEVQHTAKHLDDILNSVLGLRRAMADTMLTLAQVESLFVRQSAARRKSDELLHAATADLAGLIAAVSDRTSDASAAIAKEGVKVGALAAQALRTCGHYAPGDERRDEPEYVGIDHFATKLGIGIRQVRRLIDAGKLPQNETVDSECGTKPRLLWDKSVADDAIARHQAAA